MKVFERLAWLAGAAAVLGSGSYLFLYLYRWEWHRALLSGVLLVGAEVAVGVALLLRRLRASERSGPPGASRGEPDPRVLARLRDAAPQRDHFAWLTASEGSSNIFIPVLLGGGIVLSAVAAAIERVASAATSPALERSLAQQLQGIALPAEGFVADDHELMAQDGPFSDDRELRLLLGPGSRR